MKRTILTLTAIFLLMGCSNSSGSEETSSVYFGDLHAHSTLSEPDPGIGDATPEDFYRLARDEIGLDFVALSDHDRFLTQEEWDVIRRTAQIFDEPGKFVAFSAIEWSHAWHMNTIFRRDDEQLCDCDEAPEYYNHRRAALEARDAAGHLNHPSDIYLPDWSQIDDTLTKNVEVFNSILDYGEVPGDHEHGVGGAIWSLRSGFRFGLIGVSDDHQTDAPLPLIGNGITGCHARELTREAIIDALHDRRCYASTRERIIVDTEIAGVAMGGVAKGEIGNTVPVRVTITATATPVEIELVHNGDTVRTKQCNERECRLDTQIRLNDPSNFVYARIRQPEDQRAWSTPVWIDATCPSGEDDCLEHRLAPGGGDSGADCLASFIYPDSVSPENYQVSPAAIVCEDGDPACDTDVIAGTCTVRLGMCFAVEDNRLPACVPGRADGFEIVQPGPDAKWQSIDWHIRSALGAIFQAAHTAADKNRCSGISGIQVRAGEQTTVEVATRAGPRIDRDSLTVECKTSVRTR